MITVVIVDDHRVVARSLKSYLESFPDFRVVGVAATGEELLARIAEWKPDIVLQDLLLPGGIDGMETTRRVVARAPASRVLALTASTDEARMMGALRAGAAGYVRKDSEPEVLLAAVRAVARGKTYIDPSIAAHTGRETTHGLTEREVEVLRHVALGRSNREIATALSVGEETVKTHVAHLFGKLQVENRAQAAVQALKRGIVAMDDLATP